MGKFYAVMMFNIMMFNYICRLQKAEEAEERRKQEEEERKRKLKEQVLKKNYWACSEEQIRWVLDDNIGIIFHIFP